MVDPPGSVGFQLWQTSRWPPPESCETYGVDLDIRFAHPREGSEMETWHNRSYLEKKNRGERDRYADYMFGDD